MPRAKRKHLIGGDKVNDFQFALSLRTHGSGQRRRMHRKAAREEMRQGIVYRSVAHIQGRGTRG